MSYTLENHPARIDSSASGVNTGAPVALTRSAHPPFILLAGITGTPHTDFLDPIKTVLDRTTYDALAVKPQIVSLPRSGMLLELSLLWKSDKNATTGITTAPVVHLFGVMEPPINHPRRLANAKQIEANSWAAAPAPPFDKATFIPLMSVAATPASAITLPSTTAFRHQVVSGEVWGKTEPVSVYLGGCDAVVALLETAAILDVTSAGTVHLEARVIDA